jgi:hypothetical protein
MVTCPVATLRSSNMKTALGAGLFINLFGKVRTGLVYASGPSLIDQDAGLGIRKSVRLRARPGPITICPFDAPVPEPPSSAERARKVLQGSAQTCPGGHYQSVFTGNAALKARLKKLNIHKIETWDRNYMMAVLDSEKKLRGLS